MKQNRLILTALTLALTASQANAAEIMDSNSAASTDTVVYGSAATSQGNQDTFVVEQPANAANPLGSPIVDDNAAQPAVSPAQPDSAAMPAPTAQPSPNNPAASLPAGAINQISEQNPSISSEPNPAATNNQIQDTLYESGNRIYDIQSYPVDDVNQMESPAQPTIDNYPTY